MALTCLTRFEGWFLLFPLVGWTALRFLRLRTGRARLVCGFVCGTIALPLVFFAFGQLLPGGNGWEHLRIEPVQRAGTWLLSWSEYLVEAPEAPPTVAVAPSGPPRCGAGDVPRNVDNVRAYLRARPDAALRHLYVGRPPGPLAIVPAQQ